MNGFDYTVFNADGSYSHNLIGALMNEDIPAGCTATEGSYGEDYFHDGLGVVVCRVLEVFYTSKAISADGFSTAMIQIPEFHGVSVVGPSGVKIELSESEISFSTPESGAYTFVFTGVEILPREVTIYAA